MERELARAIDALLDALWIPVAVEKAEGAASPIEMQLSDLLVGMWGAQWEKAMEALEAMFEGAEGPIKPVEIDRGLALLARMLGPDLAGLTAEQAGKLVGLGYLAGRKATAKAVAMKPSLNLVDKRAQEILAQHTVYWIGNHYDDALGQAIASIVKDTAFKYGAGRVGVGKALKEALGDQLERSDTYWCGLAAVTMTRSRSMGAVESLVQSGWEQYEILAVMDERTSEICRRMNGRIFLVEKAVALRDAVLDAKTPEDVKKVAPWLPARQIMGPTADLPGGLALPPYHFHCRTTVIAFVSAPGEARKAGPEAPVGEKQQRAAERLNDYTPPELARRIQGLKGAGFDESAAEEQLGHQADQVKAYQLTQQARGIMRASDQVYSYMDGDHLMWVFQAGAQQVILDEDAWTVVSIGKAPIAVPPSWLPITIQ